jgi:hypothetical protein
MSAPGRVDIAMSGLSSAIHNTGHHHVRPRPVCLSSSCARSAKLPPLRRPRFRPTRRRQMRAVTKDSHIEWNEPARNLLPGCSVWSFARSQFGEGLRINGEAQDPRPPTRARPTRRSGHERSSHYGVEKRTAAHARRRFKRKTAGFGVPSSDRSGAPDKIRTCDLCLRRAALYPAELRAR